MLTKIPVAERASGRVSISELLGLAARGLPQMLDSASGLFCHRLKKTENGVLREGISHRYSMMTLLGLHRYKQTGARDVMDTIAILEKLLCDLNWVQSAGDLGLVLWTCAVLEPNRLTEIVRQLKPGGAIERYTDGQRASTMEIAWVLAGAAHCELAGFRNEDVKAEGEKAFRLLKRNCGASGLFGHMDPSKSLAGRVRGKIGTFADQVYPIYSLSKYTKLTGDREALQQARRCAEQICALQGKSGEWWWHYDSDAAQVASAYPVYSVHQHAMGPMALLAASEVTGEDYLRPITLGLEWIAGQNDLQIDMRDDAYGVVWRSFCQNPMVRHANELMHLAGFEGSKAGLKVNYECRPYELGWLLYALAQLS